MFDFFAHAVSLQEDEIVEKVFRRSWWSCFWPLVLAASLILAAFFLIFPLLKNGWVGLAVFAVLVVVGTAVAGRAVFGRNFTLLVLTNLRLISIERHGFWRQSVYYALYGRVKEVATEKKGAGAAVGLSEVEIHLVGDKYPKIKLVGFRKPEVLAGEILSRQKKFIAEYGQSEPGEAEYFLKRIRKRLGAERFEELISD